MAKTQIVDSKKNETRIPFLRGILTRSLQDAGMTFKDAYNLASTIRDELSDKAELTSDELHQIVLQHLIQHGSDPIVQRYQSPPLTAPTIQVRHSNDQFTPFSREQYRRHLVSSGLSVEQSISVTNTIYDHLTKKGIDELHSRDLGLLTYRYLRRALGPNTARSFLVLADFLRGRRPLVLLISGAPGCGKSEISTEVAHRLEIARIQSSDLLREVMRMMIPERLMPALHRSSFNAWRAISTRSKKASNSMLFNGYRAQTQALTVSCEAVIRRSIEEHTSLVLEGVHVQPGLLTNAANNSDAVVVEIMLAILNPDRLRKRFKRRGDQSIERRADRYLQNFDEIWRLQSLLLAEADRTSVPIIVNDDKDEAIAKIMKTVIDSLSTNFTSDPHEIFR